jgi:hypothetical protein
VAFIGDPDGDELDGGNGRDVFHVRDGERDVVTCGEGRDLVISDQFDQIDPSCEVIRQSDVTSLDQVQDGPENSEETLPQDDDES